MEFLQQVVEVAKKRGAHQKVKAVYIGLSYCLTVLENGACGVAFVFKDTLLAGCNIPLPKRPLAGSIVEELLSFAGSSALANSIALSTANAVLAQDVTPASKGDFIDNFELQEGEKVGMVGHFRPLVPLIQKQGAELVIFDLHPDPFSNVVDSREIPQLLPDCDVAIITATSIINGTVDDLFTYSSKCRYVAMIGPSTPLQPDCYHGTPVSCAGGILVKMSKEMAQAVMEAGGMQTFHPYLDKVNVLI